MISSKPRCIIIIRGIRQVYSLNFISSGWTVFSYHDSVPWPLANTHKVCATTLNPRVRTGLKSTWIYRAVLKSPWKLNLSSKVLEKHSKALKSLWILPFTGGFNTDFWDQNQFKLWCLYLVQLMLHQIKAPQFYTNFLKLLSFVMQSIVSKVEF